MSYIDEFNTDPNNPRYIDVNKKMEYIFAGFDLPMPKEKKEELIRKFGRPRKQKSGQRVIENEFVSVTFPDPGSEVQIIIRQTDEEPSDEGRVN